MASEVVAGGSAMTAEPQASDGRHYHSFTVSGGGDPETAPKHVRLAYMIKHD